MFKRIVLALAALVCLPAVSEAQHVDPYVKAGMNMAAFWGGELGHAMSPGFELGPGFEMKWADRWGAAIELYVSFQQEKFDPNEVENLSSKFVSWDENIRLDKTIKLHSVYFNVPVLIKFFAAPRLSIDLGPELGIAASNRFKMGDKRVKNVGNTIGTFNLSVAAGLTWYPLEHWMVQARYSLGLIKPIDHTSINEYGHTTDIGTLDDRIQALHLSVDYKF